MSWQDENERRVVIRDFSAGIDQSGSWENASPGAVFEGKNCTLERAALSAVPAPQKQAGMALSGVQTLLVHYAQNASGEPMGTLVAATQNDLLCWRNGSWQSIRGQLTLTGGQYSGLNYRMGEQDVLIAGNGSEDLLCWTGTGNVQKLYYQDETHHAPRGAALALHRERLWVGGVADARQSVFYSDDMDPASWTTGTDAAGEIQVQTWDGDAVTALAMLLDDIVIFKRHTAFRIVGAYPGEYEKVQVYATQGAIAPRTVCAWHDRALFLSDDGILQYDGLRAQPLLPGRVQDILKRVNQAAVGGACGVVWRNKYFLALPLDSAQQNNAVLEYDLVQKNFMLRSVAVRSFVVWQNDLFFTDGEEIYRYDGEGTTLALQWAMPLRTWGTPEARKRLTVCYLTAKGSGSVTLREKSEEGTRSVVIQLPAQMKVQRVPLYARGRQTALELEKTDGGMMEMTSLEMRFEEGYD